MNRIQELSRLVTELTAADLVDAMGRRHRHRSHLLDLVTPTPDRVLFGPAVTISYFPTCEKVLDPERYNFARLFYAAAGDDPTGTVLILASNGHPDTSLAGGTKLSRLQNLDMAGVVADGRLRDFDQLAAFDFATYCRGETTRWGGDVVVPFEANVPVVVSGVGIFPGDYVYASAAGAVAIPAAEVDEVLDEAMRVSEEDSGHLSRIAKESGDSVSGLER